MDKIVFTSPIAVNGMLTSHCDSLSTDHYHLTYHPCFNTQFCHDQTMRQNVSAFLVFPILSRVINK